MSVEFNAARCLEVHPPLTLFRADGSRIAATPCFDLHGLAFVCYEVETADGMGSDLNPVTGQAGVFEVASTGEILFQRSPQRRPA